MAASEHRPGDLAAHQEAAERAHLPDLAVDPLGRLDQREADVGADVEHRDLDRRDLALDVCDQGLHVDFLARVGGEAVRLAALAADRRDQRLELLGGAPGDAGDEAFAGEAAGDRAAGRIAGADHEHRFPFVHLRSPACGNQATVHQAVWRSIGANRLYRTVAPAGVTAEVTRACSAGGRPRRAD